MKDIDRTSAKNIDKFGIISCNFGSCSIKYLYEIKIKLTKVNANIK